MSDCKGCRFIFDGNVEGQKFEFCRAVPPTPILFQGKTLQSWYPQVPTQRCGLYRKLRFWMRKE